MAMSTLACTSQVEEKQNVQPTNIIFLIGDGMGLSAVSTGFYFGEQPSVFTRKSACNKLHLPPTK